MEVKGLKKFKKEEKLDAMDQSSVAYKTMQARDKFRRMTYQTSYAGQFGEPPKAAEAYIVMKKKKFSDLDISQFIQPLPKQFIDMWLSLNTEDEFIKRIFFVTRDIHTIIKNAAPPISYKHSVFTGRQADGVPRFDKMILKAQEIDRAKSSQGARLQKQREEHTDNLSKLILGQKDMQRLYAPVIDTKDYKQ